MSSISSLCVFCGSSMGVRDAYAEAAKSLGGVLAQRGIHMVYGGSNAGLMGCTARGALEHQGKVTGVITRELYERTDVLKVSKLVIVDSMHERKASMYGLSDAFIALPGGIGTLEELLESLTWNQLGIHTKPVGLLNTLGFFDPLLTMLDHLTSQGFLRQVHRNQLVSSDDPSSLLDLLSGHTPSSMAKWQ